MTFFLLNGCCSSPRVILTPGVNFINAFMQSVYARRSGKRKKLLELTVFFALLGSVCVKAARKMLVKLSPAHSNVELLSPNNPFHNKMQILFVCLFVTLTPSQINIIYCYCAHSQKKHKTIQEQQNQFHKIKMMVQIWSFSND